MNQETRLPGALRAHPLNAVLYGEPDTDPAFIESIREEGILTPLTVDQDDTIISGHRRWHAATTLGLDRVPVVVREIADPLDATRLLIEANRQREKSYSQRMREADEWAGVMAVQSMTRMAEGGRQGGRLAGRGRPLADPIGVAPYGATPIADEVDATTERFNERRSRTFQRERYIWHIAEERGGDREAASLVARALAQKLDAKTITPFVAEQQLREAVDATERRAALPPEQPRPLYPEHAAAVRQDIPAPYQTAETPTADPWDEPDVDPDAGLYSRPEPPAPEWPREHVATTYDAAPPSPPVDLSRERARQEQATSDAYIKATKDAATECAEDRAVFFRAVRIIKEQVRGSAPEKAIASLQPGDDQQAHWFLDDVEEWCRELRAGLPRRLRSVSGERG